MKEKIQALINEKKFSEIREEFRNLNNVEISDLLNQFDKSELIIIFRLLSKDQSADVFSYLEPEQQEIIINAVTDRETEVLFRNLYFDDMIDIIEEMPSNLVKKILKNTNSEDRYLINQFLNYPENSAGSIMTYSQGFAHSSNVGMTLLQQKMGDATWLEYLNRFKFGVPTRFGMPDEYAGQLPADNVVNIAMSAFGQGISVTQTQMFRAFTAIANDGVMLEPKFISALYDPNDQTVRKSQREVVGNPVSKEAASLTRENMILVGTDPINGTMYNRNDHKPVITVPGQTVSVKSGTAQIADEQNGGYLVGKTNYIFSVVTMHPSENPDFILYVTVQQPEHFSTPWFGEFANPILERASAMKDILNLQSTAKNLDQITTTTSYAMPSIKDSSPGDLAEELRRNLVQPIVIGSGTKIKESSVAEGTNLDANQQILLLSDKVEEMPDLYGWSKKNVETFAKWLNIEVEFEGSGQTVKKQSVRANTALKDLQKIKITLGD